MAPKSVSLRAQTTRPATPGRGSGYHRDWREGIVVIWNPARAPPRPVLGWWRDARAAPARPARGHVPGAGVPVIKRAPRPGQRSLPLRHTTRPSSRLLPIRRLRLLISERNRIRRPMASNYVDTTGEEGRFHGPHHHHRSASTTPTGAAASSPRTMRRSFSSASSTGGHSHSHGGGGKCVCAPPTHAGSFKCRLHRTNSQGHGGGHPHPSPPTSPAQPAQGAPSSVEAQ